MNGVRDSPRRIKSTGADSKDAGESATEEGWIAPSPSARTKVRLDRRRASHMTDKNRVSPSFARAVADSSKRTGTSRRRSRNKVPALHDRASVPSPPERAPKLLVHARDNHDDGNGDRAGRAFRHQRIRSRPHEHAYDANSNRTMHARLRRQRRDGKQRYARRLLGQTYRRHYRDYRHSRQARSPNPTNRHHKRHFTRRASLR